MRAPLGLLLALLWLGSAPRSHSQSLSIITLAGSAAQGGADGTGAAARFLNPWGVAADSLGNLYAADTDNHTIRKITSGGSVSTLAGLAGVSGAADGAGSDARFNQPQGVAVDNAGNIYVADTGNYTIRKITPAGTVTTLAGSPGLSGTINATGASARFYEPEGIAVNGSGTLVYVADTWNHIIRQITSAGAVTTLAGSAGIFGTNNGTGTGAQFYQPQGIAVDGDGNVYVADTGNQMIRKVTADGLVTTLAGSAGNYGSADGTGSSARFWAPQGLALDSATNLYVADSMNNAIREVTPAGVVTTVAGTAGTYGSADGTGAAARFWLPQSTAVDGSGNIYVADSANGVIRMIASDGGVVTTLAGSATTGSADATGSAARFDWPSGATIDSSGNTYVADTGNSTIRTITPAGVVSTLAGSPGQTGSADATGANARFNAPRGIAVDASGTLYVADTVNQTIREVASGGVVTTLAGLPGTSGLTDGTGPAARFNSPQGLAVSTSGIIYVADTWNHTIRKVTSAGAVTTLAGLPGYPGSVDGTSIARFSYPTGVAVDTAGNVYVADTGNHVIRKVTSAGVVSTLAGLAGVWGSADGTNSAARFCQPQDLAVDASGNLYVLDTGNQALRMVSPSGTNWVVTTLTGVPNISGSADGTGTNVRFCYPAGLGINQAGTLCVADLGNNTIRAGISSSNASPTILAQPQDQTATQGQDATFSVVAAGSAALSYQWLFNGGSVAAATDSSFTRANAQPSDAGSYAVVVANSAGSVTSAPAVLVVNSAPTPPGIALQPQNQAVSQDSDATFTVTATGSTPLNYQWLFSGASLPGANASSYSVANAQATDAGSYSVIITNAYGSISSAVATLTVLVPPSITEQPQSQALLAGTCAVLSVGATGSAPLSYQWQWNGVPQASATLSSYTACNAGSYSVLVSNLAGVMLSDTAFLTLTNPPPLASGHFDSICLLGDGSLELNMSGAAYTNYNLQVTTDWTNWSFLALLSGTNGFFQFNDPSVATNTARFYRLQVAP